ncbi:ATP-binding cassette domain-containing protein [Desulfovibrio aminophilus]|uniref:ABC transporter ATP-binding protein n=1 Tax=Desulfovibrio aminophilus TaxID=81425 RepID=UPI003397943B
MERSRYDIRLEGLSVGYGEHVVVSNVNVTLPGGKITVILGGSGSGKSTLLKHILRLHRPIAGRVTIGGHDIFQLSRNALRCLKQRLGLLFQDGALLGSLTLFDNVALPLREHTRLKEPQIAEVVRAKLALVGLADSMHLFPNQLSGGMRKRAGLARAMVMDPEILFCDEPTSGLDPVNSAALDDLLLELKRRFDMTLVVVSHDLASMRRIADHVVVLGRGKVIFDGTQAELEATEDPYLRRFLERRAEEGVGEMLTMPKLDPKVMKIDCSKYLGAGNGR